MSGPSYRVLPVVFLVAITCMTPRARWADASESAFRATYLSEFAAEAARQWPSNRTLNIVCHGHSVPAGYFKTPTVDTFNAYPHLLHRELKKRYPCAVINVIVTAIGGEASDRGAERFDEVLAHRPDVLLIDYALNDRRIGPAKAEAAWRSMIERALEKDVKLLLLTPTADTRAELTAPNDPLQQHAAMIRRLAAEYGVGLVDSLAAFEACVENGGKLEDLMSQANHPNRAGHELVVREAIRWFPEPPTASNE